MLCQLSYRGTCTVTNFFPHARACQRTHENTALSFSSFTVSHKHTFTKGNHRKKSDRKKMMAVVSRFRVGELYELKEATGGSSAVEQRTVKRLKCSNPLVGSSNLPPRTFYLSRLSKFCLFANREDRYRGRNPALPPPPELRW